MLHLTYYNVTALALNQRSFFLSVLFLLFLGRFRIFFFFFCCRSRSRRCCCCGRLESLPLLQRHSLKPILCCYCAHFQFAHSCTHSLTHSLTASKILRGVVKQLRLLFTFLLEKKSLQRVIFEGDFSSVLLLQAYSRLVFSGQLLVLLPLLR